MESGDSSQSVRVAVNIRPLVTPELLVGCTDCITVYPAQNQVAELKKKQDAQAQPLRQKQKSDEAAKRLQDEIHRIKTQKPRKEGRRNEYEMHKLLALNQRQNLTEEAAMATKRLKELVDSRKASPEAPGNENGPGIQAIKHELEFTLCVHEVRSEYERQMKERAKMAEEVAKLKDEALFEKNLSDCHQTMSPGASNSRIFALENMLATSSSTLVSMASQLSEAEECKRAFSGRGRWNQVHSLVEAKNIMNFLFNWVSSSRCQLRDREVDCREYDSEIKDLKEKNVDLVRQLELQKAEFTRRENLMKLASKRREKRRDSESTNISEGHNYDLRSVGSPSAPLSESELYGLELLEDMDTSDDCQPESSNLFIDDDTDWEHSKEWKLFQARNKKSKMDNPVTSIQQLCCSCSKNSTCKTLRCECRAARGSCSLSCSCVPTRCSNREDVSQEVLPIEHN